MTIEKASATDQAEILALYRSLIGQPGCTWCEEYPDEEIVAEDQLVLRKGKRKHCRCGIH